MAHDLGLKPGITKLVVNRAPNGIIDQGLKEEIANQGLDLIGILPQDEAIYRFDCEGKPTASVPENSPIKLAMKAILGKLGM
jgi:CO dehydrogenase maturation factor